MQYTTFLSLLASLATANAVSQGFNYGNTMSDGSYKLEATYVSEFKRAQTLQGTNGAFTSARLYTMIQGGSTSDPIQAISAAISTKTTLLLGLWASGGQAHITDEIAALKAAITQYGTAFTDLVVGISVGSEDLYRVSPTGIENDSGAGASPQELVNYIKQTRSAIAGTSLSGAKIGHVDTWTAWVNGSNVAVTNAVDWLGVDSYPYFENTVANSIATSNKTFFDSYDNTVGASKGKEVWVTETGWPVSGPKDGQAVASIANAEKYWQQTGCDLFGVTNTWWYTIQDDLGSVPSPSFGLIGENINSAPLYNLQCKKKATKPTEVDSKNGTVSTHGSSNGKGSATKTGKVTSLASASASASSAVTAAKASQNGAAAKAGSAAVAGIVAVFALMVTL